MQSIPIPTDNLSKFTALFGLVLFITALLGTVYVNVSTNQQVMLYVEKAEAIEASGHAEVKPVSLAMYERLIKIAGKDKSFYATLLGSIGGIGFCMMWYGFRRWYKYYQPKNDKILELTIAKLELEIENSNKSSKQDTVTGIPS